MKNIKLKKSIEGAQKLSLGISIVVAILMGIGLGVWMKNTFAHTWLLWLGVFWGVAAAVLNIYKEYKLLKKSLDEIEYKEYEIKKSQESD
ncbi:MAG: AtpZ/AtpI family protein [Epsilonproteobacteria bacterium]|nr:AtpZ/AtpI family protein [Campylobacterota bacterium]